MFRFENHLLVPSTAPFGFGVLVKGEKRCAIKFFIFYSNGTSDKIQEKLPFAAKFAVFAKKTAVSENSLLTKLFVY